jgi:hypothetical protein
MKLHQPHYEPVAQTMERSFLHVCLILRLHPYDALPAVKITVPQDKIKGYRVVAYRLVEQVSNFAIKMYTKEFS